MSKHTATPWRLGTAGTNSIVADAPAPGIGGSDSTNYYGGHLICESVNNANAAHIVRCVNNFDALLEALEALLSAEIAASGEGLVSIANADTESGERAVALARRALAAARGEA